MDNCCAFTCLNGLGQHCNPTPIPVSGVTGATQVAVGCTHACALKSDGTVWCWGTNSAGQLGTGDNNPSGPRQVASLTGAVGLALGCNHSCAIKSDGSVVCWGNNGGGQLGNGVANANSPVPVQGLPH
jgi:alpha-tubulin suppressor-like RCC1 family protein